MLIKMTIMMLTFNEECHKAKEMDTNTNDILDEDKLRKQPFLCLTIKIITQSLEPHNVSCFNCTSILEIQVS